MLRASVEPIVGLSSRCVAGDVGGAPERMGQARQAEVRMLRRHFRLNSQAKEILDADSEKLEGSQQMHNVHEIEIWLAMLASARREIQRQREGVKRMNGRRATSAGRPHEPYSVEHA